MGVFSGQDTNVFRSAFLFFQRGHQVLSGIGVVARASGKHVIYSGHML